MSRRTHMLSLVPVLTALAGCGGLSLTIDRGLLRDVSIENKLQLFDAENDVSITVDERDQIQRSIQEMKGEIHDAQRQILDVEGDEERASAKGDAKAAGLAQQAREVFKMKIEYLETVLQSLRERFKAQEDLIMVAQAKFELAKAKLVKKNNMRGAVDVIVEDFEAQVDRYVERAKEAQAHIAEIDAEAEAQKKDWLVQREKLQTASGGGLGSPWAEDSSLWGGQ